jgi:hypothetical protein
MNSLLTVLLIEGFLGVINIPAAEAITHAMEHHGSFLR